MRSVNAGISPAVGAAAPVQTWTCARRAGSAPGAACAWTTTWTRLCLSLSILAILASLAAMLSRGAIVTNLPLRRVGDGVYETRDGAYQIQNPHGMDPTDRDRQWYAIHATDPDILWGPFDTLRE